MHQSLLQTSLFEVVERDAWLDLFAAAPDECARKLGIASQRLGHMGVLASREVPIVEFNRAMCVGTMAPATGADLDEASEWLRTNAAPGWALQVGPVARTTAVDDWLQRHAMTASGTGWAKFQRGRCPPFKRRHPLTSGSSVPGTRTPSAQWSRQGSAFPLQRPDGSQLCAAGRDGAFISPTKVRHRWQAAPPSHRKAWPGSASTRH
jgi:hypothetical protein